MRRKEREVVQIDELLAIIDTCKVCRLGLAEEHQAYVVPLNFGYTYDNNALTLYFHGAHVGKKIEAIKKNNKACFELDCDHQLIARESACNYSFAYASIIGFGTITFITTEEEKVNALNSIMKHQIGKEIHHEYKTEQLKAVAVYKINVSEFTGKRITA